MNPVAGGNGRVPAREGVQVPVDKGGKVALALWRIGGGAHAKARGQGPEAEESGEVHRVNLHHISPVHTLRVIWTLGPLALSFLRDHKRWIWWGTGIKRTPEFHRGRARKLVRKVVRLGPTFVKIAQVFASRADLIPEPYLGELGTLVDQVPPLSFETVRATIQAEYGRDVDELFESFERDPIAAASLAQVHRARLHGETVAVKVLRPGVELAVSADLAAYRRILRWLDRVWGHPHIKRELTVADAVEVRISEEVDFRQEAAYATEIRANFAGNENVVIPRIIDDFVRRRVLVMEFLEGTRVDRLDPAKADPKRIVQTLVELYIQMELIDGLFHADPHPGNVLVSPEGKIILVDFGAVVRVPLEMRRALVHTSIAAVRRDTEAVAEGFMKLGLVPDGTTAKDIRWIADILITSAYEKTTARQRIDMMLADKVMTTLLDSPIILTEEAVYFARAATLLEGIGTRYDPYFQVVPVASPVVLRMRSRILRSLGESVTPNVDEIATVAGYALGKAAASVRDWVRDWSGRVAVLVAATLTLGGCARTAATAVTFPPAPVRQGLTTLDARCDSCGPVTMRPELAKAIETRISDLKTRGGPCQSYGEVLERSYASGQITLRPFMWRQEGNLASGSASTNGHLSTAMDIDSLNVGVRTVVDVLRSIEHEAAHVAFQLPSRDASSETLVESRVRQCSAGLRGLEFLFQ
jgi:predicted unusual protein kinase regulating ubiquinone biosynthesis (AarF/ABC1/UbiB family)